VTDTTPGTATGKLQQDDLMTFTFSETIAPTWTSPASQTVILAEGPGSALATLLIPNLTDSAFDTGGASYQGNNKSTSFASTITVVGSSITVKLGTASGGSPGTGSGQYTIVPSATIKDAVGNTAAGSYTSSAGAQLF
jgi:hypothetical protein